MKLNEYQHLAMRTRNKNLNTDQMLQHAVMNISGEAGEVMDLLKKHMFQGHGVETSKLINELGDILWGIAEAAEALGVPLSYIAEQNIAKLQLRYPDGFEEIKSTNRGKDQP